MEAISRERVANFVKPLYQDLDGVSRLEEVLRISAIARRLYTPSDAAGETAFELLLLFQGLGSWLQRVGNLTRAALATGVAEADLRRVAASLQRIEAPDSEPLAALASAIRIDEAGLRGLASRIAAARREGSSLIEIARQGLAPAPPPEWMPPVARRWFEQRMSRRRTYCEELLREQELADLD